MAKAGRVLVVVLAMLFPAGAWGEDLHQLWDQRCGACHGHAGPFARDSLRVVDGHLRDRQGRDVEAFLAGHNGGYSPDHVAAIIAMLKVQTTSSDLFQRRCGFCHETAAQLVRDQVVRRDGGLAGRGTGRPLAVFLHSHGKLEEGELAPMLDTLDRIEREVRHP